MRNLGNTIDRLLEVDISLRGPLTTIKKKWKKDTSKRAEYWKELIDYLNTEDLMGHPKREQMKEIINSPKSKKPNYSFEEISSDDIVIGLIPEYYSDLVKKYDLESIKIAKMSIEANMTRNKEIEIDVARKKDVLDIRVKKVWIEIRDYFKIWDNPGSYNIKRNKDGFLFLIQKRPKVQYMGQGMVRMDLETLKQFFRSLGIEPPLGLE